MPTKTIPAKPAMMRGEMSGSRPKSVDREKGIIRGGVCALVGTFKDKRGQFVEKSLETIRELMAGARHGGLRARFTHPALSVDGLGKFLGRWRNPYLDEYEGKKCVRADFHLSPSSRDTPSGDLGGYILRLADEDPEALSSSLVLSVEEKYKRNDDGTVAEDEKGDPLPPIWFPTSLWALDFVDVGDAVDGLLSVESLSPGQKIDRTALPDALQRQGFQLLDQMFGDAPEDVIRARMTEYLNRYLHRRGGVGVPVEESRERANAQNAEFQSLLSGMADKGIISPFAAKKLGMS